MKKINLATVIMGVLSLNIAQAQPEMSFLGKWAGEGYMVSGKTAAKCNISLEASALPQEENADSPQLKVSLIEVTHLYNCISIAAKHSSTNVPLRWDGKVAAVDQDPRFLEGQWSWTSLTYVPAFSGKELKLDVTSDPNLLNYNFSERSMYFSTAIIGLLKRVQEE